MPNLSFCRSLFYSDLPLLFVKIAQSSKTGFVHLYEEELDLETIPIYENICFALALFRQKTIEGVNEGKKLLERLFRFQIPEGVARAGSFPVYLHEYPISKDSFQMLKIAPLLKILHRDFGSVMGAEFKELLKRVLERLIDAAREKRDLSPFPPLWECRFQALEGNRDKCCDVSHYIDSSITACEALLTSHLLGVPTPWLQLLVHPQLQVYTGPCGMEEQEGFSPRPNLLEWMSTTGSCISQRLKDPHSRQLSLTAFGENPSSFADSTGIPLLQSGSFHSWKIYHKDRLALTYLPEPIANEMALRLLWQGEKELHNLVIPTRSSKISITDTLLDAKSCSGDFFQIELLYELPGLEEEISREVEEVALFLNLATETHIYVEGKKSTAFEFDQCVEIQTPTQKIAMTLMLIEGNGRFFGSISQGNRPFQRGCKKGDFYAYDWKISWRTLQRSSCCKLKLTLEVKRS